MMKIFRIIGFVVAALIVAAALAYQFRTDPIGPLAGKRLSGEERPFPSDWAFVKDHPYCFLETRPSAPHSVTTICFVVNGKLVVPSLNAAEKDWPYYVLDDPSVRIKSGRLRLPSPSRAHHGFFSRRRPQQHFDEISGFFRPHPLAAARYNLVVRTGATIVLLLNSNHACDECGAEPPQ